MREGTAGEQQDDSCLMHGYKHYVTAKEKKVKRDETESLGRRRYKTTHDGGAIDIARIITLLAIPHYFEYNVSRGITSLVVYFLS
jgi:hypothetical protein